jgi:hypothetical protein
VVFGAAVSSVRGAWLHWLLPRGGMAPASKSDRSWATLVAGY